ncbi:nucleotidyltransferase domain-containing protein [Pyrofollis japonicus]|uniref:nucleotidyltransferase domain-containing protein n=1 Tax=Pyrofollis japonicus TaxID=3060460 RepID=UPI00295C1EC8|nr:nucleotidyltransferase domain-containing protein [Pyrofollis japonicus]BEP17911.1 nucleotidyltransferase domain-containing protein [Pyrofollis japonicus]
MPKRYGSWVSRQFQLLRDWRRMVSLVAEIAAVIDPYSRVYVFGSIVEGRYTGASDIDVLILTRIDPKKLYEEVTARLWDLIGEDSAILDLHVVPLEAAEKPPVKWWLRGAIRIR